MGATKFALRAAATSLGLFALLRLPWVEAHVVWPVTNAQGSMAVWLCGSPAAPIAATLACSGTDVLALCLGAILAYPVSWRARVSGAVGGTALILVLNTLRIGTLGRIAASPAMFDAAHLYVWPALLTLAIGGYVLAWMRAADRAPVPTVTTAPQPSRRFLLLATVLLGVFVAASPLILESAWVLGIASLIATATTHVLALLGIPSTAAGNVLSTASGAYLVTQECIATPLLPIYLAGIGAYAPSRSWRLAGVVAALPLFIGLGILRLLLIALPLPPSTTLFLVHGFFKLLVAALTVIAVARWRFRGLRAAQHAGAGLLVGAVMLELLAPWSTRLVQFAAGVGLNDPQGAMQFLPAFQISFFVALWIAAFATRASGRRLVSGLAMITVCLAGGLLALHLLSGLSAHAALPAAVVAIRAIALAGPLVTFAVLAHADRAHR